MKALLIRVAAVLLALATQAECLAQQPATVRWVRPLYRMESLSGVRPYFYHLPYAPYYRYHAGTAAESYARGIAARVYAQGQYNRLTAEANVIDAEAYRREIENRELAAQTYFAMRQANREARAAERGPRAMPADLARFAAQDKPGRLSPSELSATGKLSWPLLLQADDFAPFRAELEKTFAQRAADGGIGAEEHVKARWTTNAMLEVLKTYVREVNSMDYTAARRFLQSLAFEIGQPVG